MFGSDAGLRTDVGTTGAGVGRFSAGAGHNDTDADRVDNYDAATMSDTASVRARRGGSRGRRRRAETRR